LDTIREKEEAADREAAEDSETVSHGRPDSSRVSETGLASSEQLNLKRRLKNMKIRKRVITPKKGKRYYSYSLTLTIEQIEWLSSNTDSPALMRKVIDDLMKAESEAEAAKFKERAELLSYKAGVLYDKPNNEESWAEARRITAEIIELNKKVEQIEENIEERERKRKEREAQEEAARYG
jgi:hypothetical protein